MRSSCRHTRRRRLARKILASREECVRPSVASRVRILGSNAAKRKIRSVTCRRTAAQLQAEQLRPARYASRVTGRSPLERRLGRRRGAVSRCTDLERAERTGLAARVTERRDHLGDRVDDLCARVSFHEERGLSGVAAL
jgi:hypothetical protein